VFQLQRFVAAMAKYHNDCHGVMKEAVVFPIEVDLSRGTFTYDTSNQFNDEEDDEEEEEQEVNCNKYWSMPTPSAFYFCKHNFMLHPSIYIQEVLSKTSLLAGIV
jgi:hypothetical protein